jgi:hypothetical protein
MKYPSFKKISIGGIPAKSLIERIMKDMHINTWAKDIALKIEPGGKREVRLTIVSVRELGLTEEASWDEILAKGKELGLETCPPETALHLRIDYTEQPIREWVYVAMEPIDDPIGKSIIFRLGHGKDDYYWILGDYAGHGSKWRLNDKIIFCLSTSTHNDKIAVFCPTEQKPTIIINIKAGLGNQLFQYAYGRALSLRTGDALMLDITDWLEHRQKIDAYRLPCFNTKEQIANSEEIKKIKYRYGILTRYYQKIRRRMKLNNVGFAKRYLRKRGDIYLDGYWQSEKYFVDQSEEIRKELTLKNPMGYATQKMADMIRQRNNSISVHIRREFVATTKDHPFWGISTQEYYSDALEFIAKKIPDLHVFVFSDDIGRAKKDIRFKYPTTYVSSIEIPDYEELILMSMCKHNIIANSSFSWWAAWLNNNPDKIVVAPKIWSKSKRDSYAFKNIIPTSWIRI